MIQWNSDDYDEKYNKNKFLSDDNLPLNKTIEIPIVAIVVRAVVRKLQILSATFCRWVSI